MTERDAQSASGEWQVGRGDVEVEQDTERMRTVLAAIVMNREDMQRAASGFPPHDGASARQIQIVASASGAKVPTGFLGVLVALVLLEALASRRARGSEETAPVG